MKMLRFTLLSALLANLNCAPALAQWQVQNHSVPIGRGSGVTGFGRAVPATAGLPLSSAGPSADPVFQLLSLPAIVPVPAYTLLGNPTGVSAAMLATQMGFLHSKDFGAVGNNSTDDTGALQTWLNACANNNKICFLDAGDYKITSTLNINLPREYHIVGENNVNARLRPSVATQDALTINTSGRVLIENMGFVPSGTPSAGACINVNTTATVATRFYDLFMTNCWNDIASTTASQVDIRRADVACLNVCLSFVDFGDSAITESAISPAAGAGTIGLNLTGNPGGLRLVNNKFNGSSYGTAINIVIGASDGDLIFVGNSIEGWVTAGISIARSGTPSFGNLEMSANQIGGTGSALTLVNTTANWFANVAITGNVFSGSGAATVVNIGAATNMAFVGNNINGGTGTAVAIGANVINSVVSNNICDSGFSLCINNLSPTTTVGGQSLRYNAVSALAQNTTNFVGAANNSTTEAVGFAICPKVTKLQNLFAQHTAPASGQTVTSTLRVAGADTAVTCTSTGPATSCNDVTHSAYCTAGQTYSLKVVTSATTGSITNYAAGAQAQ